VSCSPMAASFGANGPRGNFELNLVPMIDLMSCLTAFLLVTAVWVNTAQLQVSSAGRGKEGEATVPRIGVLVQSDRLWLTVSELGDITEIPDLGGTHNWTALSIAMNDLSRNDALTTYGGAGGAKALSVSVAAESTEASPVLYQELISAVDIVNAAGFEQVGITDVEGLALAPQR
jgi:biopolymer transport protein ExbD